MPLNFVINMNAKLLALLFIAMTAATAKKTKKKGAGFENAFERQLLGYDMDAMDSTDLGMYTPNMHMAGSDDSGKLNREHT